MVGELLHQLILQKDSSFAMFSCCWETISCFWASCTAANSSLFVGDFKDERGIYVMLNGSLGMLQNPWPVR